MAIDKSIDSTQLAADLTSVADAIRSKGGTSAQLAFPAEFVSAIEAIATGSGGDEDVKLLAEGGFVLPEQTSAAQTVTFSLNKSFSGESYKFLLAELDYAEAYPTAPTEVTLVKKWDLFQQHSNYQWYIYDRGSCGICVKTDGSTAYTNQINAVATLSGLLNIDHVQSNAARAAVQLKAKNSAGAVPSGNWYIKIYGLSMQPMASEVVVQMLQQTSQAEAYDILMGVSE